MNKYRELRTTIAPATALAALADRIIGEKFGTEPQFELLDTLAVLLAPDHFRELCDMLDICPEHLTDTDTCYDDELDCRDRPDA